MRCARYALPRVASVAKERRWEGEWRSGPYGQVGLALRKSEREREEREIEQGCSDFEPSPG